MPTAKWSTPGSASSNLAGTALDGLAAAATSTFLSSYANGTALDLYAGVLITLGAITPTAGATITVRVFSSVNGTAPDNTAALGGGDAYTVPLTTTNSAKTVAVPMIRLYPGTIYLTVTNNSGVAFSSSAGTNTVVLVPYDEASN